MRIMCCLKPVPKPGTVKVDPETHTLKREGSELELNPYFPFQKSTTEPLFPRKKLLS